MPKIIEKVDGVFFLLFFLKINLKLIVGIDFKIFLVENYEIRYLFELLTLRKKKYSIKDCWVMWIMMMVLLF